MHKHKIFWGIIAAVIISGAAFLAEQVYVTRLAHTTFERYYAFRGCAQLIDRTDTTGECRLSDGSTLKLVLIDGAWYRDGDGPGVW